MSIVVSYSGVHQAFQAALAAHEQGVLERFMCSLYDGRGKWGRRCAWLLGSEVLRNRRVEGVPPTKVVEYPWPELAFKLRQRVFGTPGNGWIRAAISFDRWAALRLRNLVARAIICSENCACDTFRAAKALGWKCLYDCPGHNAELWNHAAAEAARRCGLASIAIGDSNEVSRRKQIEIESADVVLCYSDFHARGVVERGVSRERIRIIPLWADTELWKPTENMGARRSNTKLRVIFAGSINVRKGVPFLIDACKQLMPHVQLTLVGRLDDDVKPCLRNVDEFTQVRPPVSKLELRSLYHDHDLLVLPSLGDSFGFVGMEAMACGLPIVVTDHCGVPVPDKSWRVPVMDSVAITERLQYYLDSPECLERDGAIAAKFAQTFTPARYRAAVSEVFSEMLGN